MDKLQFIESEARRYETAALTYEQPIKKMKAMMDELKVASETLKRVGISFM